MKIGEFIKIHNTTKDTLRHYIDIGLLIPKKNGAQYDFDDGCSDDFEEIQRLKNMGFKLNEIKNIFFHMKLGKLTGYREDELYKEIFNRKNKELEDQIQKYNEYKSRIEKEIEDLSKVKCIKRNTVGVNINILSMLACHICKGKLKLKNGKIEDNKIINGYLECECGHSYSIEDGILKGNKIIEREKKEYEWYDISKYILNTEDDYLEEIMKSIQWSQRIKEQQGIDFSGKVLIDLGVGSGFSLRCLYDKLGDDTIYFAVDHDMEDHRNLKKVLEKAHVEKNIVLMCMDFEEIPLRDNCIDVIIDGFGSSNYAFQNEEFLLRKIERITKESTNLFGLYNMFKKFDKNTVIKAEVRDNFRLNKVKEKLNGLGYRINNEHIGRGLIKGGKYDNYFLESENMYFYSCYAERE
ncbi:MerR family transcriptional regulator [Oceanirhabdus sp. W0125-5]|uniref:MerR family transcriptional regulator n=1 Tax=Oceanirhabdus sp. W0125-5 TaxID=2999116 RepID=UPI0022F2DEFA|nr:MerR family transcriptional regulator [Oceanirhabdus sp. W0125-5]WBW96426.1 MerR family transcriptional regulator [Oceanirhabdus sp. W0125-5]